MRAARQEKVEAMRPVCIYTAGDRIEAEMLLEALQRNDIQGFREARGSGGAMDVYTGNSIYGEKIYVDEQDAEHAEAIIGSILAEAEMDVEPEDEISDQTMKTSALASGWRCPSSCTSGCGNFRRHLFIGTVESGIVSGQILSSVRKGYRFLNGPLCDKLYCR